jgi:pimeloyl-ACP methyl ester carboxylesterase
VTPVLELIGHGEPEAAAREFVEIVLGPGAWEMLPEGDRATMVRNADTFAGEALDPAWADIDLDALSGILVPVLFTQGDQSPPMFAAIIARLSAAMERAEVRTLPGAGHVPHATHPADYVAVVSRFAAS